MQMVNSTHALWTWHRNQDIYRENSHGDQLYIVRQPHTCSVDSKDSRLSPSIPVALEH
uniref:Nucleotide pyrophosphatase/phosphodiesterase n=1 Tax=Solanum tuberosum TaxID=4113 RepID=M1BDJ3_SOLTU